uniref:BPTI/Kunitz inhibitor domain-containing protein n=1 Tax=Acrobeloides nanus TaxID=290746 RepID=A0A914DVR7_9BILA
MVPSPIPAPEIQENSEGCPIGQDPFEDPLLNRTKLECDPTIEGTCPPGFSCFNSRTKERFLCCGTTSICTKNSAAFINPMSKSPVRCTQFTGCPPAFFCYKPPYKESLSEGICCSEDPVASLCDHGTALRASDGRAIKCTNNPCPRGYNCLTRFNISICCPTNENVCTQPLHRGLPCEEAPPQAAYYFDVQSKACQEFSYSGCSGNDNLFESLNACQSFCKLAAVCSVGMPLVQLNGELATCSEELSCLAGYQCVFTVEGNYCCPKPEMTCSLPRDQGTECGPSDNLHSRSTALFWYFSTGDSACIPFEFRGCGGNFNRFITQQHCSMSCLHALCPIGSPKMDQGKLVKCNEDDLCPTGYLCAPPRFAAPNINICCPRPEMLCLAPEEKETHCSLAHYRYRYDTAQERCVKFVQSGCAGTTNSFATLNECEKICLSDDRVCPQGSELYVMPDSQRAMSCSPLESGCPPGYKCHANIDSLIHFCCSEPRCPSGKMPLLARNGSTVACSIGPFGFFDGCPSDYSCQQTSSGKYMCCPRAKPDEACPYPSRPFLHSGESFPTACSEAFGTCPFGYVCHQNRAFRANFCCSDLTISVKPDPSEIEEVENPYLKDSCNDGSEPYKDEYNVRICNPHLKFSCPEDYECQYNGAVLYYSTTTNVILEPMFDAKIACPTGLSVKLHPKTKQPIVCKPDVPEYCPLYSRCEYSSVYWQFICCTSVGVEEFYEDGKMTKSTQIGYYPGQAGCLADSQCQSTYPAAYCHDWICRCPDNLLIMDKTCVENCPDGLENHEGICARIYRAQLSIS